MPPKKPMTRSQTQAATIAGPPGPPGDPGDDDDPSDVTPMGPHFDPYYDHVLLLLGFNRSSTPGHPVLQALHDGGYTTFPSLFQLRRADVEALTYTAPLPDEDLDRVPTRLPRGTQTMLLVPQGYRVYFQENQHRPMTSQDWLATSVGDIHDYIMSDSYMYFNNSDGSSTVPASAPAKTQARPSLELFRKTIRRDPSQFKPFTDKRHWATWHLHFVATARAQDLQDILDSNYVPRTADDRAVFQAKQEYLYSVFVTVLLTDEGKALVRTRYKTSDAQAIFAALCDHYTKSTHSELVAGQIMQFLTTFRLGRQSWKGKTAVSFIAYYVEQLRLYDELTFGWSQPLDDHFKRAMLDAAVQAIDDLRQVRITQSTMCQGSQQVPTFEGYLTLLHDAAMNYDHHQQQLSSGRPDTSTGSRRVYATLTHSMDDTATDLQADPGPFFDDYPGAHGEDDDEPFDLDVPLSTVTAYAAQRNQSRRPPSSNGDPSLRLPDAVFTRLSPDDRRTWSRFGPDARRLLLGLHNGSSSSVVGTAGVTSIHRRVLLAEGTPSGIGVFDSGPPTPAAPDPVLAPGNDTQLLTMMTQSHHHPGDVRRLLSTPSTPSTAAGRSVSTHSVTPTRPSGEEFVTSDGTRYRRVNMSHIYSIANATAARKQSGALIDRGANGGLAGSDCRIFNRSPDRFVNVEGIDRHQLENIPIVSCGAYTVTRNHGPVIVIFHQFAGMMRGPTIISSGQLEAHLNTVNDRSRRIDVHGQLIITPDGFEFPLHIRNGLPYMDLRPYTDHEWDTYPHVVMTSDVDWDPSILDGDFPLTGEEVFYEASAYDNGTNFDVHGNYRKGTIVASARVIYDDPILSSTVLPDTLLVAQDFDHHHDVDDHGVAPLPVAKTHGDPLPPAQPPPASQDDPIIPEHQADNDPSVFVHTSPHLAKVCVDPEKLRPFFAFLPTEVVERTMQLTTQYARIPVSDVMHRYYKSPYPALNVPRRDEDLLTDVVYSDTPAIDDGSTSAAIYSGKKSHVMDVYGMKTDKQFVNTLEDIIRERGAPNRLLSDHAILIRSSRILDILRALCIGQWTSEPHRQNQNTMERRYQTAKRLTNLAMDRSGCPPSCWLLCLQYICLVLNCTACKSLGWQIPLTVLLGVTVDVSPLLRFHWYQPVFYKVDHASFPSESPEALGYFVGIVPHCGHVMTFKVLTADTHRVLFRSQVRPADDPHRPNLRLTDLFDGEPPSTIFVRSKNDPDHAKDYPNLDSVSGEIEQDTTPSMVHVDTSELIGKTFLMEQQEDGTKHRARIVELIEDHQYAHKNSKEHTRFRLSVNNDQYEETMTYGEVLAHINKDEEQEVLWRYKRIMGHQGPLALNDKDYNGCTYNVQVEWENGEVTFEPLSVIAVDDPVTCAIYAREHGLLDTPGWKRFKRIANREQKLLRMANQAKLRSYRTAPRYKYGFEIPRNYEHALYLDRRNGNTKWQDANKLEFDQLDEYSTFEDIGPSDTSTPLAGYKKIRVHLVFDVKHDGRHKVRCVADGHLTEIPLDSVYSGVVSLRGLRIMLFLAELNDLEVWATDIGNAYLEAQTKEKIYIIAGSEFGSRQGHILLIKKALYGLRSSGKRWHERFADCLRNEGFEPCKAEPDIWLRPAADKSCYEMVAVYVDDLAIGMKDPKSFLTMLMDKHKFKLKGSGPISFHLGCDFERDDDGVLCMSPKQYIDRMVSQYERMFGSKPRTNVTSPLEKNDHPEVDDSELLDEEGVQQYQSLIGSLQWAVSLGRFDVTTAVMTLSSFRAIPRRGHLERAKRVVAYLYRFKSAQIRFRTHEPDLTDLTVPEYDWTDTVYGKVREEVPADAPLPLGKSVVTVSYVDANLMHCLNTGRSVTGILHFLNGTPIDW